MKGHPNVWRRFAARRAAVLAFVAAAACASAFRASAQQTLLGGLRGVAYDKDFGVPLGEVRVTVVEAFLSTVTNADGGFVFDRLPSGSYTVSFAKDGYERLAVPGVVVAPGRFAELRVELVSEVEDMEELVVTGADLLANSDLGVLEVRAAAVQVQDAISAEMISKAGVGDAAGALKMVVGASVAQGKYATVRGLSDRYTGTTLNGVRIPSPDPRRRAVQVDIFPTGTLDSVTVTKSFTPDLQGDFTGGGVDIRTKSVPESLVLSFSLSTEYNADATGNPRFLSYENGGVSRLAYDDGSRALPEEVNDPLPGVPPQPLIPRANTPPEVIEKAIEDAEAYDRLTRAFAPVIGVSQATPGSNHGFSLVAGNRFVLDEGGVVGLMGALSYARKYDFYENGVNNEAFIYDASAPIFYAKVRKDNRGTDELLIGGLGTLVFRPSDDHELSLQYVANQSAEDEARIQLRERGWPIVEQNQSLRYTERRLRSRQVHGRHHFRIDALEGAAFSGVDVDWAVASNATRQIEPDVRFFVNYFDYESLNGFWPQGSENFNDAYRTRRVWRDINEDNNQLSVNAALPLDLREEKDGAIRAGFMIERSDRVYFQRSYSYTFVRQAGRNTLPAVALNNSYNRFSTTDPEELWTDVFLDSERIGLASNDPPAVNQLLWVIYPVGNDVDYDADQAIDAVYGMVEVPLAPAFKVIGGVRHEETRLFIDPENPSPDLDRVEIIVVNDNGSREVVSVPDTEVDVSIEDRSNLPSLGFVWELAPAMNLRASWSRTLARPTFRELAQVAAEEFLLGDEFMGNPDLLLSKIENYDLRWEWFRAPGEVLAASAFQKNLENPIEFIAFAASNRAFIQPINYPRGKVRGGELEVRLPLGAISETLSTFTLSSNFAVIRSEVELPDSERASLEAYGLDVESRRLQGQPEYLFNAGITWDDEHRGASAGLFFNYTGETLVSGAARGTTDATPDVLEASLHVLDLSFSKKLGPGVKVTCRARNILPTSQARFYRRPDGEEALKSERTTPTLLSLGLTWSW